jgi:hypothetical protein
MDTKPQKNLLFSISGHSQNFLHILNSSSVPLHYFGISLNTTQISTTRDLYLESHFVDDAESFAGSWVFEVRQKVEEEQSRIHRPVLQVHLGLKVRYFILKIQVNIK